MAEFDWNQYPAEKSDFDWNQFPSEDSAQAVQGSPVSELESYARGAAQGGTLGFRDELAGLLASPTGAAKTALEKVGVNYEDDDDIGRYKAERDESRRLDQNAEAANWKSYLGGQASGGIALPLAAAAALPAGAAGVLGAGGTLAATAGAGALSGAGMSNADTLGGLAADTATGGVLGAATYGLGKAIPKVAGFVGDKISDASTKAGQSLSSTAEKLASSAATGRSNQELGRTLLDQGLVRFGDTADQIGARAGAISQGAKSSANQILGDIESEGVRGLVAADALRSGGVIPNGLFPDSAAAYQAEKQIIDQLKPVADAVTRRANSASSGINARDVISHGVGAVTGGPIGGVVAPIAQRAVADRALSSGAVVLNKAGSFLMDPSTIKNIAPKLGKYGKLLLDASERSPKSLAATHFLLDKTDGEYREKLREVLGETN